MPNAFEELLAQMADVNEQAQLKALGDKYPELREGILRQSDYSRKLDEFKPKLQELDQWNAWRNDNWDAEGNGTKAEVNLRRENQRLQELISKGANEEMTQEQINQAIANFTKSQGLVSQAELDKMLKAKEEEFTGKLQAAHNSSSALAVNMAGLMLKHQNEFGAPLDTAKFYEEFNKGGHVSLEAGYDSFVSSARNERARAEQEKALAAAREEGRAAGMQEAMAGRSPIDNGSPNMGAYQAQVTGARFTTDSKYAIPEDVKLDSPEALGALAAQRYRENKAAGK